METKVNNSAQSVMQVIQNTPAAQIPDLDFVKDRYIANYNACNPERNGDLMYHRNVIHFKQIIAGNNQLMKSDPFSLYACFATAAANGYSLDPNDNEVYVIARGGKACLDRQAGAYIRKLMRTGQIKFAEQAKLVYKGDEFYVENGRVIQHIERFQTDEIVAGYVRMVIADNGADRYFIYRRSDWESWRKKSPNPRTIEKNGQNGTYLSESLWDNGIVNGTQPEPNFLRTKIVKHAAKEKCWATGNTPANVEVFTEIEVDTDNENNNQLLVTEKVIKPVQPQPAKSFEQVQTVQQQVADDDFVKNQNAKPVNGKVFFDEDF